MHFAERQKGAITWSRPPLIVRKRRITSTISSYRAVRRKAHRLLGQKMALRYPQAICQDGPTERLLVHVGAREHHARYLGTAARSAHAWCECHEVRTCELWHAACEHPVLPENIACCARLVKTIQACPPGRLLARKATST